MRTHLKKILAITLAGTAISATPIPMVAPQAVAAVTVTNTDLHVNKRNLATEEEAAAANKTWYGEYIDPDDITSIEYIELKLTGQDGTTEIRPDEFNVEPLSDGTNTNEIVIPKDFADRYTRADASICIHNYNETGYDLYFDADTSTSTWYMSLNTKPDATNKVITTNVESMIDDPGDKTILLPNITSFDDNAPHISSFSWMTGDTDIQFTYDDIVSGESRGIISQVTFIDTTSGEEDSQFEYTNIYELFGAKWMCVNTIITSEGRFTQLTDSKNASDRSEFAKYMYDNVWIKSNGQRGDRLEVTQLYDMVHNTPLEDNNNTVSYVLKEDNESLPVGYGAYLIYNKSTGIYETTCTCVATYGIDYRLYDAQRRYKDARNDTVMDVLTTTGIGEACENASRPLFDVPKTLNLTNPEYTPLVRLCNEERNGYTSVAYTLLPNYDAPLAEKILTEVTRCVEAGVSTDIPYTDVTLYNVPTNTTDILAYFATNALYSKKNVQDYKFLVESHVEDDSPDTLDNKLTAYFKSIGAEKVDRYAVLKSGTDASLPSYNGVTGDMNQDGTLSVADAVMLQKYLLGAYNGSDEVNVASFAAANLCKDDSFDVFDLVLLKRLLLERRPA